MAAFGRGRLRVISLEPSGEAFGRLKDNLRLNQRMLGDGRVAALNCAMSDKAGVQRFYEPVGHLSNGSFDREFASRFSESVKETSVVCVGPAELRELVGHDPARVLIKLDCEGAEPMILAGLDGLLRDWQADLLVDITDATAAAMNEMAVLTELYEKFQITSYGLRRLDRFEGSAAFRDWFLQARANR
jgi:FkbM family methyltransferase